MGGGRDRACSVRRSILPRFVCRRRLVFASATQIQFPHSFPFLHIRRSWTFISNISRARCHTFTTYTHTSSTNSTAQHVEAAHIKKTHTRSAPCVPRRAPHATEPHMATQARQRATRFQKSYKDPEAS